MPKAEVPNAEVPKADVPKAEVPKAVVPKADVEVPKADVPKAQVPRADVPKADGEVTKAAVAKTVIDLVAAARAIEVATVTGSRSSLGTTSKGFVEPNPEAPEQKASRRLPMPKPPPKPPLTAWRLPRPKPPPAHLLDQNPQDCSMQPSRRTVQRSIGQHPDAPPKPRPQMTLPTP